MKRLLTSALLSVLVAASLVITPAAQSGQAPRRSQAPAPAARTAATTPPSSVPRLAATKYTLPNGLEVILSRKTGLPMVAVNLYYHVGPANEDKGRTGFAHLFEHMMFQKSKHVPEDSYIKFLEDAGASDFNGTTNFDYTNYFETVPAGRLELALWLESDRMGYLLDTLDRASFANQQDVVRNERRQSIENTPYGPADEELVHLLFPQGHPYYASIIGSHQDIQAANLDDAKKFFKQFYAPNNATLAIVGDFDAAQIRQLVAKYFGTFKKGDPVAAPTVQTPPITSERRKTVPSRVELQRVSMAWLTAPFFKPGDAEADMTATILGGGRSSRLYKSLVYEKQIAQSVQAYQQSLQLQSIFQIEATARPGHTAEELEKAIDEEIAKLVAAPPDASEVERARNTFETATVGGLESISGLAHRLNIYNHYLKTPDYIQQDFARYRTVTPAIVQQWARDNLKTSARAVVYAVPGQPQLGPPVPTPEPVKSSEGEGTESVNKDEPWRANPPKGFSKPLVLETPQSAKLANGLDLILVERHAVPIIAANLVFKNGSDSNPQDKPGLAAFTAAMLDEGTTTRSSLQIADAVAQLGASLATGSGVDSSNVTTRALTRNFPAALDILADVVLHPSFPADELERQRASRVAQLAQIKEDPADTARRVTSAVLFGANHPYGYPELGTEAAVKAMKRDDLQAFWQQNYVPNNAALVVAGDITMAQLRTLAEKTLGGWQMGTPARPKLDAPAAPSAKVVIVDAPGAPQTQVRVATLAAPRSSPDFRPLQLLNIPLGGNFSSRINLNLREKNGFSYGTNSQVTFRRAAGTFQVGGGVRTDATGPAVNEIMNELKGVLDHPITAQELAAAKDSLSNSLPGAFETNANAVANYSNVFTYDLGLDYYANYAEQVRAVTLPQTAAVATKYVVPQNLVVVAVGDKEKIEPELKKLNLGPIEHRDAEGKVIP
ncbi:MAG TPA: pitrilysin family protein [Vicinamibacterales bacterium]|nr:pitrilysin family protein [Vicinamibacterales bacterium]